MENRFRHCLNLWCKPEIFPAQIDHYLRGQVASVSPHNNCSVCQAAGRAIPAGLCGLRVVQPVKNIIEIGKQVLLEVRWDYRLSAWIKPVGNVLDVHLLVVVVVVEQQFLTGTIVMHAKVSLTVDDRTGGKQLPAIIVEEIVAVVGIKVDAVWGCLAE